MNATTTNGHKPFSARLRALRDAKALTQESCALLLGISKRCLEEWEYGNTEPSEATQRGAELILKGTAKRTKKRKETK